MSTSEAAWLGHERGSRGYRLLLLALLLAGVATFAQLYSVQGVLPLLAADLHLDAAQAALAVSLATLGLALAVLPWARAADRFGRLPVMKASLGAAAVAGVLTPLLPTAPLVLGMRFVEGVALGGVPAIAVTYLTEEVHRAAAAVAAGTYVSGTSLGGLFGRIVAAPIAEAAGWRIGVLVVAVASALAALGFALLAPAAHGFRRVERRERSVRIVALLRDPRLAVLYAQAFLLMGGFVAVYNYLAFRLQAAPFGLSPGQVALLFLAYLAGTASSRLAGGLAGRIGRRAVLVGSVAVMAAGVLLTLPPVLPVVVAGLVVLTAGFFAAHGVASGWVGVRAPDGARAQAASLYNLCYYAGSSLVGWGAGFLFTGAGWGALAGLVVLLAVAAGLWAALQGRGLTNDGVRDERRTGTRR